MHQHVCGVYVCTNICMGVYIFAWANGSLSLTLEAFCNSVLLYSFGKELTIEYRAHSYDEYN